MKMEEMELVPSWIRVFDKYDNCRRFLENPVGRSTGKVSGYCAIAYLCYHRATEQLEEIRKNIQPEARRLFEGISQRLGGLEGIAVIAEQ